MTSSSFLDGDGYWRTRLAGGGATHLSSHARHPRPATSDTTRRKSGPSPADSLKESQLAAGPGPSPRRRTSPTRRITTASLEGAVRAAGCCAAGARLKQRSASTPLSSRAVRLGYRLALATDDVVDRENLGLTRNSSGTSARSGMIRAPNASNCCCESHTSLTSS